MLTLGPEEDAVDPDVYDRTVARFKERQILLPTFEELARPGAIPAAVRSALASVKPDDPHPLNLFRVHWYNDSDRHSLARTPIHVVLPRELTGVDARIVVLLGDRFPMVRCHKVLATYGCLAPRVVTGQFDPTSHRAVWPSTGNFCRGGVAVSKIMSCHGVAVLPERMSRERFAWLEDWVLDSADIVRTPGGESNVKEIYDKCAELSADPANTIFNQFSEFGNHLVHYLCTGAALGDVFETLREREPQLQMRAFVAATGSAGAIGAGDYVKEEYGARIVALEALECPTMLSNGFGEHNIQGIGDKHVPLIHNVYNTDIIADVSDRATDQLAVLFSSPAGLSYLADRAHVPAQTLESLGSFGLSSICNVLGAVATAKYLGLGPDDVVMTVATDGAEMYGSERRRICERDFADGFDETTAGEVFSRWMLGADTEHLLETTCEDRERVFNLGYYTWVEQQGVPLEDFVARREQSFWKSLRAKLSNWDEMIREFNSRTGVAVQ